MKGFIISPTYRVINDKAYVVLFGKLENGESFLTINKFNPYFYIKEEDLKWAHEIEEDLVTKKTDFKNKEGNKVAKVIFTLPADVQKIRKKLTEQGIDCYENDIRFQYRYLIDHELQGSIEIEGDYEAGERVDRVYKEPDIEKAEWKPKLKILAFDIEASHKDANTSELYCISIVTNDGYKKVFIKSKKKLKHAVSCKDEEELLEKFINTILDLDPDVITGWNVIDFDLVFLQEKCKEHKIPFMLGRDNSKSKIKIESNFMRSSKADISGRVVLDAMNLLAVSFIKLADYKLNTAARTILGEGKLVESTGKDKYQELDNLYKKNQQKLVDYNLKDSELVIKILEKSGVLALSIQRSLITGMPLDRVSASIASLDSLYIKEARKRKLVVPSSRFAIKERPTTGGYVREAEPGIYDYILILDFKSLYPSIIRTFNIDPLSYVEKGKEKNLIKAPNGAHFKNEEGILPSVIQELWKHREEARKEKNELARYAIKILMNSLYGSLASPACRFFDPNIANAITHFAQFFIKFTSKKIEEKGYKVIYNDSITKDRFVTLLINDQLTIKNIEELFEDYKLNVSKRQGKYVIQLSKYNVKTLTLNKKTLKAEFSKVNEIIRHKVNKKLYRINQKYGETVCTQDHSLMTLNGTALEETKPLDLGNKPLIQVKYKKKLKQFKVIDLYEILKDYDFQITYKGRLKNYKIHLHNRDWLKFGWTNQKNPVLLKRFIRVNSKEFLYLCRLVGFYIADGSSSTKDTTSRGGASISNSDISLLEEIEKYYHALFRNVKTSIIPSMKKKRTISYSDKKIVYEDKTNKLQIMNGISAVFFKMLGGQKSLKKKLPGFIFHVPDKYKVEFLRFMRLGDGGSQRNNPRYSEDYVKKNFSYTSSSLHLVSGLTFLLNQLNINYSLQYRPSKKSYTIQTSTKNNKKILTKLGEEKYVGYVYDLNVDGNNMFVDSCGQILLHNTDSTFVVSKAKSLKEAEKIGKELQDEINTFYKGYVKKKYKRTSYLELEFEKTFIKCLMPKLRGREGGAKKRYAGLVKKDGKEEILFTGLETVRSDWTDLAKKYQNEVYDRIFHNKEIANYTKKLVADVKKGKYDKLLVYRKSIRKELGEYKKTTPPHVKAARKLEKLESDKIEYVITEDGPEPIQKIEHKLDYDHYIKKQIKPIAESVLVFFNKDFDDLLEGSKQATLF